MSRRAAGDGKRRILITAGPTREYIDPVRFLSNDSSGKMGFALAAAALARGHRVTLIHGPVALAPPVGVRAISVVSATEMLAACRLAWPRHDVLIMAAAVADYAPAERSGVKLKKAGRALTLRLRPTADILAELSRRRRPGQVVVGFALEDRAGRARAAEKLERKRLDAIVLNWPSAIGASDNRAALLVRGRAWKALARRSKADLAKILINEITRLAT